VSNKTKGPKEQTLAKTTYVWGRRTLVLITITLIRYPRWRLISWKLQNTVTLVFGAVVRQNGQKCTITFVFGAVVRQNGQKCTVTFVFGAVVRQNGQKCTITFVFGAVVRQTGQKCTITFVFGAVVRQNGQKCTIPFLPFYKKCCHGFLYHYHVIRNYFY
jgi:hypothetical protein